MVQFCLLTNDYISESKLFLVLCCKEWLEWSTCIETAPLVK